MRQRCPSCPELRLGHGVAPDRHQRLVAERLVKSAMIVELHRRRDAGTSFFSAGVALEVDVLMLDPDCRLVIWKSCTMPAGKRSELLAIADQAKQFCPFMQGNVAATFDLGDKHARTRLRLLVMDSMASLMRLGVQTG
jgi:hypothetical protein